MNVQLGGGSTPKCKHVATSLYRLESLTRTGKMQVEVTCTQKSQTWHAPRKGQAVSSPTKAARITYKVHNLADEQPTSSRQEQHGSCEVDGMPGERERDRLLNLPNNYQVIYNATFARAYLF